MNIILTCFVLLAASLQLQSQPERKPDDLAATRSNSDVTAILRALPADTSVAVLVKNLAEFDAKLSGLSERLGVPFSPYTLMKGWIQIVEGLDDAGSAAVALIGPPPDTTASKRIVILLPTLDRSALLTLLKPEPLDGGCIKAVLRGRESYVGAAERFTVFGPDLEVVRRVVGGKVGLHDRLGDRELKRFQANDLSIWVDPGKLPISLPMESDEPPIGASPGDIPEPPRVAGDAGGGSSPSMESAKARPASGAERQASSARSTMLGLIKDFASIQLSVTVEPAGLVIQAGFEPVEGTHSASSSETTASETTGSNAAGSRTTESLLSGLPAERFVLAIGLAEDRAGTFGTSTVNLLFSVLTDSGVMEPARGTELRHAYESVLAKVTGASASISILPDGPNGRIGALKVLHTRDGVRELLSGVETIVNLIRSGTFVDPSMNDISKRLEYRRAAETSGSITIDHLAFDITGMNAVNVEEFKRLMGQEGLLVRVAAIDNNDVVVVLGGGLPRFNEVVATVHSGQAPLAADSGIAASAKRVAAERYLEAYFSVDRFCGLLGNVWNTMGPAVSIPDMPELNTPVALTMLSPGPGAAQVDVFIPTEVIVALKNAAMARLVGPPRSQP